MTAPDNLVNSISVPVDLNGPPGSANGGVAAGLLAGRFGGAVTVRLFSPPPVATPMEVVSNSAGREARLGGKLIMAAWPGVLDLEPPQVTRRQAEAETAPFVGHPAVTCFVCGPENVRGLHLLPGPVDGGPVHATTWTPAPATAGEDGVVLSEVVWGALDCPGAIMFARLYPEEHLVAALGTITAEITEPLVVGETYSVLAWPRGREGRKLYAGTAIADEAGSVHAIADQVCVAMPVEWGGPG